MYTIFSSFVITGNNPCMYVHTFFRSADESSSRTNNIHRSHPLIHRLQSSNRVWWAAYNIMSSVIIHKLVYKMHICLCVYVYMYARNTMTDTQNGNGRMVEMMPKPQSQWNDYQIRSKIWQCYNACMLYCCMLIL